MKWFIWFITSLNLWFGIHWALNALHIWHNSKYSQGATVVFAVIFLGMGAGGLYCSLVKGGDRLALLIGLGPWIVSAVFLLFSMLTSDYK